MTPIKVLSVRQPWAYLIANGIKTIENRDWTANYRGLVLIHAGKEKDLSCFLREFGGTGSTLDPRIEWTRDDRIPQWDYQYEYGGIVGIARLVDAVTESKSPWFRGKYGWVFDKARPLPLIPCKGNPLLLDAPADIVERVKAACARERGAA